jgi:hypothetical protein
MVLGGRSVRCRGRADAGGLAAHGEVVLDGHGHPGQGQTVEIAACGHLVGLRQRRLGAHAAEGTDTAVEPLDPREVLGDHLAGGDPLLAYGGGYLGGGVAGPGGHRGSST